MADVNYVNPTGLAPKFDWQPRNALAGMQWVENRDDYRRMYEQQMRMQAMSEEEKRMEIKGKQKNIPLQELERATKMQNLQGALPFQGQMGATGAQAQVNTNQINASPKRHAFEIDKFKKGMDDNQWTQYTRSMAVVGPLTEQAIQIAKTQGPMAAQQWISQQAGQAKQAGVDLPPFIMDPKSWEPLYNASVQTAKHAQEMSQIDRRGVYSQNVAEIHGGYGLQQGRERNASNERIAGINAESRATVAATPRPTTNRSRFSTDQNIQALVDEIRAIPEGTAVPPQTVAALTFNLEREYEKMNTGGAPIRSLAPELQEGHIANQQNYVKERLTTLGIERVPRPPVKTSIPGSTQAPRPNPLKQKYGLE